MIIKIQANSSIVDIFLTKQLIFNNFFINIEITKLIIVGIVSVIAANKITRNDFTDSIKNCAV